MDNITHSLAGLLLADAALLLHDRLHAPAPGGIRARFAATAAVVGVIGANLPDTDVPWHMLLQALGRYDTLSSLLHHRGYTHTLLAALLWIPLLWGAALFAWRRQLRRAGSTTHRGDAPILLLLAAVSVLSHTLLDFTNDYGVHPLSPFVNKWFYGDTIFIIEPWLWVVAVSALLRTTAPRAGRVALGAVLALGLGLSWLVPMVSLPAAIAATIGAVVCVLVARRSRPATATALGITGWIVVTMTFALGTGTVRAAVRAAAPFDAAPIAVRDIIVSPSAGNPVCARVITVESSATDYRLTTAFASAWPQLASAEWCARAVKTDLRVGAQNLAMTRVPVPPGDAIAWGWTWSAPRAELLQLARGNCQVAAWLRFVRVPFWTPAGADSISIGDLRYDRDRNVGVAKYTFASRPGSCPPSVPPWTPARVDVWPELDPLTP